MKKVVKASVDNIIQINNSRVRDVDVYDAERILIDNGISEDEAQTVLQAIGYALLDTELYPEEYE